MTLTSVTAPSPSTASCHQCGAPAQRVKTGIGACMRHCLPNRAERRALRNQNQTGADAAPSSTVERPHVVKPTADRAERMPAVTIPTPAPIVTPQVPSLPGSAPLGIRKPAPAPKPARKPAAKAAPALGPLFDPTPVELPEVQANKDGVVSQTVVPCEREWRTACDGDASMHRYHCQRIGDKGRSSFGVPQGPTRQGEKLHRWVTDKGACAGTQPHEKTVTVYGGNLPLKRVKPQVAGAYGNGFPGNWSKYLPK